MASAADICNIAARVLGVKSIMSLDQRSPEAEVFSSVYPIVRDAMLSEFNWRFATRDIRLAALDEELLGPWRYVYANPSECLRVQMIHDPSGLEQEGVPFSIGFENRVYTNISGAVARCTMRVTNEGIYPPHFVDVFGKRIAVEAAGSLQNVANRVDAASALYNAAAEQAQLADAGLGKDRPERIPMLDARVYGMLPED